MDNLAFDIDLGLLFAFALAFFSAMQWIAVLKQNNQNLFQMRLEHYKHFYTLSNNLSVKVAHYKPEYIEELDETALELNNYIDESQFLFDEKLYNLERLFADKINRVLSHLPPTPEDIDELNRLFAQTKQMIEGFLKRI